MKIDQLRNWFPDESACRQFFKNARLPKGRICPHCGHHVSYAIHASHRQNPCYQCKSFKRQFTVTTKTVLHNTGSHHIKINVYKALKEMIAVLNGCGMIRILPEAHFPILSLIKFLSGSPCYQLDRIWYNITFLIINSKKMDMVRCS